jgi:hypothetical protein
MSDLAFAAVGSEEFVASEVHSFKLSTIAD